MGRSGFPGEFEQMVLLAVLQLQEEAFAPAIAEQLELRAGRRVSRGALYATLERLESKGWVEWSIGQPSDERGGYRKRSFTVTREGLSELRAARRAMEALADGLDDVLAEGAR